MDTKVTITADKDGNIIGISQKNPEYGYVRVEQVIPVIDNNGWFRLSKRSALIKGKVSELVDAGFKADMELPGKIIIRESLVPFNPDMPERDLKIAGDSGVICRVDDQPIYRQSFYTTNVNLQDELIQHTNTEEIKEVLAALREMSKLTVRRSEAAL